MNFLISSLRILEVGKGRFAPSFSNKKTEFAFQVVLKFLVRGCVYACVCVYVRACVRARPEKNVY